MAEQADRAPLRRVLAVLVLAVVVGVAVAVALALLDFEPDVARVLLVAVGVGSVVAVLVGTQSSPPTWERRYDRATIPTGQDVRTSGLVRAIESNRTASEPHPALRERLRELTAQTLGTRHGLVLDDPDARSRIGPRLAAVIDGPPRRVSVAELDACLDEIEGL